MLRCTKILSMALVALVSWGSQAQLNEWKNIHPSGPENALGGPILWVKYGAGSDAYMMSRTEQLYRRQDSGSPWEPVSPTLDGVPVLLSSLFFDSNNPQRIIANRESGPFPNFGAVLESLNGGDTWTTLRDGAVFSATRLTTQSASNSNEIIAYMPVYYINETPKLAKTFDGGVSWVETEMQKNVTGPYKISSADSNVIYGLTAQEFNKSVDGGVTWDRKDEGLGFLWYLNSFDSSESSPDIVYGGSGAQTHIAKSVDGAETWQFTQPVPQLMGPVHTLKVHPANPDLVYVGTEQGGNYYTENGGLSWAQLDPDQQYGRWLNIDFSESGEAMWGGYTGVFVVDNNGNLSPSNIGYSDFPMNELKFAPGDPAYLYAGSGVGGFAVQQAGSDNWSLRNGVKLVGGRPESFSVDLANPERVVAAGSPTQITNDAGLTWIQFDGANQPETSGVWVDPTNAQRIFATGPFSGLMETFDEGNTWSVINSDAVYQETWLNKGGATKWFARSYGIGHAYSQDGGATWEVLEESFNGLFGPTDSSEVAQDHFDNDTLYLIADPFGASADGVVWRSTDFGVTWNIYGEGSSGITAPVAISADPFIEGRVYVMGFQGNVRVFEPSENTWFDLALITFDQCGFGLCSIVPDPGQQGRVLVQNNGVLHEIIRDIDLDGVGDSVDNCTYIANPDQRDANFDSYGSVCDADLNNDGIVNFLDISLFSSVFLSNDADADFNGDGAVNFLDLPVLQQSFLKAPGPNAMGDQ